MISVDGPYRRIGEIFPYEINQDGIVRTASDHSWGEGYLLKPAIVKNGNNDGKQGTPKMRCRMMSNDGHDRQSFKTIRNVVLEVWGISREFTDGDYRQILELCNHYNSLRAKSGGESAGPHKDPNAEPLVVNGKRRYCQFCGQVLTRQDCNYFYHSECLRDRGSVFQPEDIFHGAFVD